MYRGGVLFWYIDEIILRFVDVVSWILLVVLLSSTGSISAANLRPVFVDSLR